MAFLRAVNVRPRWVKMSRLREVLVEDGFQDVETYIQSGNVKVSSSMRSVVRVRTRLEEVIEAEFGFPVPCIVRTPARLREIAEYAETLTSPLDPSEITETERRYVTMTAESLTPEQLAFCNEWRRPGERLHGDVGEIYWWLGMPTHQAKMSNARLERLGVVATTRDIKVVRELAARWGA
ncbi:DUF1697 domain-containing protein [Leekyejoonella antrihumi]|uniref:DUF1697 domain-containing protein n=1 Tax=Leekyejoonella antrihumi TaxID=1660198 RepID=UPI0016468CBB|nr:DUF1697 domain-containing protein [Leekyejoonella antrihumi]